MIELVNRETGELLDADSVPGLAVIAALHDERIARVQELLEELMDGEGSGAHQRPIVWDQLTPMQLEATWRSLAQWVGWLRGRYPLAHQLPACWWRHPELVEELSALWLAWRDAYIEKGAALSAGADWHARALPELLRRLRGGGWNLACEDGHRPLVLSLYDDRAVDVLDDFEQHISTAVTTVTSNRGARSMDRDDMDKALASGAARRLGQHPDSPVATDDGYWMRDADGWASVDAEDIVSFLRDAESRLLMADRAVAEIGEP